MIHIPLNIIIFIYHPLKGVIFFAQGVPLREEKESMGGIRVK
jgi:hypothetical protein